MIGFIESEGFTIVVFEDSWETSEGDVLGRIVMCDDGWYRFYPSSSIGFTAYDCKLLGNKLVELNSELDEATQEILKNLT